MQAYWLDADLTRAYKLLELMTGNAYAPVSNTIVDPRSPVVIPSLSTSAVPRRQANRPNPALGPPKVVALADLTPRLVCTFLQTALATRDRGKVAHALSTVEALSYGAGYFDQALATTERSPPPNSLGQMLQTRRDAKTLESFWRWRLADTVENAVDRVLSGPEVLKGEDGLLNAGRRRKLEQWADLAALWKRERGNERQGTDLHTVETMAGRRRVVASSRSERDKRMSWDAPRRKSVESQEDDLERDLSTSPRAAYVAKERSQSKNWTEGIARVARAQEKRAISSSGSSNEGRSDGRGGDRPLRRFEGRERRDDSGYESDRPPRRDYGDDRPKSRQEERPWTHRSDDGPRSRSTGDRPRSRSFDSSSRGRERPSQSWGSERSEER